MFSPGEKVRWWLQWAAVPYALAARLRAKLYKSGWLAQRHLPVPVISIGNLTMGGTGKTPIVIQLAEWLLAEGKRVGILSRGYRRSGHSPMLLVSDGTRILASPEEAGDEPHLIARRCPQAIVAVGANRYELGRWVLDRFLVDCLLLDDGYQHLGLRRDLNLLLVDATDPAGLDAVVPAGRLREPMEAAARADLILMTRADAAQQVDPILQRLRKIPIATEPIRVVFRAEELVSVLTAAKQSPQWCQGKTAALCSGVGHAGSFRATAESLGLTVLEEVVFQDHHRYRAEDVERLRAIAVRREADLIITTEKDAGKLSQLLTSRDSNWWAVRLVTEIAEGEQRLRQSVLRLAHRNHVEVCA